MEYSGRQALGVPTYTWWADVSQELGCQGEEGKEGRAGERSKGKGGKDQSQASRPGGCMFPE